MPSLTTIPYEILVRIALDVACIDILGPPLHLPALLRTCRHIHASLTAQNDLFARIFKAKFDITAARRRFGPIALLRNNLAAQLKQYCVTLKRIRHDGIYAPTLEEDLWTAFIMFSENDAKNAVQLKEYARLHSFADALVRTRLHEFLTPTGWPVESTVNNLGLWLLWMSTDLEKLQSETPEACEQIVRLILPFVMCAFHYPAFYAADIHFNLPLERAEIPDYPTSIQTAHGAYPQYPDHDAVATLTHFGQRVTLARPLAVPAAQLLYFARRELRGLSIPPHVPNNRAHALTLGQPTGPTRADYEEFNAQPGARTLAWGEWGWRERLDASQRAYVAFYGELDPTAPAGSAAVPLSSRFDADWERLLGCTSPWAQSPTPAIFACYARGSLVGRWGGRMLITDQVPYMNLITEPALPAHFSELFPYAIFRPVLLTLKEHHCISPEDPVDTATGVNALDEGVLNGYLPASSMLVEEDNVTFTETSTATKHRYETLIPGKPSSHSAETCAYCQHRLSQESGATPSAHMAEIEEAFEEGGLGRGSGGDEGDNDMDVDDDDEDGSSSYDSDDDGSEDGEEEMVATFEEGPCNGILDIVFTGLTEERHGDAWCHYMYYGRLRAWDGLVVLVGVPNDVNARLWGKWVFRGYLHGGQNFTGRWRHYSYDVFSPPYEGAFSLSKRN